MRLAHPEVRNDYSAGRATFAQTPDPKATTIRISIDRTNWHLDIHNGLSYINCIQRWLEVELAPRVEPPGSELHLQQYSWLADSSRQLYNNYNWLVLCKWPAIQLLASWPHPLSPPPTFPSTPQAILVRGVDAPFTF
jgi:hypothetical protein